MPRMDDDELKALVMGEVQAADTFYNSEIAAQQAKAMEEYLGDKYGNEVEGRSQIVMTDVQDTVESVLPSLMRIFTSTDTIVQFDPVGPEDDQQAKQRTEFANHVFMKENNGFMTLYTWFKDALLQKNGVVKAWWQEKTERKKEAYSGLDDIQFSLLLSQPDIQLKAHTERVIEIDIGGQPTPVTLHDVEYEIVVKDGKVVIENVPPEEFLISREAATVAEARFVGHRVPTTKSELIAMGYPKKVVEDLPTGDSDYWAPQAQARFADSTMLEDGSDESASESMRRVWVTEGYIRADYDGDGIAELRKVTVAGNSATSSLLDNEEWAGDRAPFYSVTPIILPHRFYGRSMADLVSDLQLIRTTIMRQLLDNMYLINNNRWVVDPYRVELDDFLTSRPGGVVRLSQPGDPSTAVVPLATSGLPTSAFGMLEYIDGIRENRTGITRYNQGLDANSLNKTASGISQIMNAAQQRLELIARVFAETGVKELFTGIDELVSRHQDIPKTVRLRGEWVTIDPRDWQRKMDVTVTVGLGTGNKQEMLQNLYAIIGVQEKLLVGGMSNMVSPENIYQVLGKMVENAGLKQPELYFTPPGKIPPPPPPPDPKMIEVQAKVEADKARLQAEVQMKAERNRAEIELAREKAAGELQLQREKMMSEITLAREKAKVDMSIKAMTAAGKVDATPGANGKSASSQGRS